MGLFGNIHDTVSNLTEAIESLVSHPFRERSLLGVVKGGTLFVKGLVGAVTGSIGGIFESLRKGFSVIVTSTGEKI